MTIFFIKKPRRKYKINSSLLMCCLLFIPSSIFAQYTLIAPESFGPNGLPIPELKTGKLAEDFNLKVAYENHNSPGDATQNTFIELFIPIVSNKVALVLSLVPKEHYSLDAETVAFRKITKGTASGTAVGDVYVGTHIQVVKDKTNFPDVLLAIDIKTASGTNSESARFTDAPGYIFDLSGGKNITLNSKILTSIRPFAMAGFYVYQTNKTVYRQNDAFLYGLGFDLNFNKIKFSTAYGGYHGYIEDGDRPVVWRSTLRTKFKSIVNYELRFGKGLDSNFYDAIRLGLNINLDFAKNLF